MEVVQVFLRGYLCFMRFLVVSGDFMEERKLREHGKFKRPTFQFHLWVYSRFVAVWGAVQAIRSILESAMYLTS